MANIKWIFFDCMETVIEVKIIPDAKKYSEWAYAGSGQEKYWKDSLEFAREFEKAIAELKEKYQPLQEYELRERFAWMVDRVPGIGESKKKEIIRALFQNYWANYRANCYIGSQIPAILQQLGQNFKLGVVSNFKISGGVEELLRYFDLDKYFHFIITSIGVGWSKPHPWIYQEALQKAGVKPEEVVFVGDNYDCDYWGPRRQGLHSVLLDQNDYYPGEKYRVKNLGEVKRLVQNFSP